MEVILVSAIVSAIVSAFVAKKVAVYHFEVIDSYVRDMIEVAKREINKTYANRDKH